MIFFASDCAGAMLAAKRAVKPPIHAMTIVTLPASMIGKARATRYTPAATIVAAWIIALTGVGPSIASGNQTCNGNWALLPTAAMNSSMPIPKAAPPSAVANSPLCPCAMIVGISSVPSLEYNQNNPAMNAKSPMRTVKNAFFCACCALFFL